MQPQVENATPEEFDEWQQTELNWWADRQLSIVALMSVVQVVVFGLMLLVFYINSKVF
jgi:intracellular septation protein A